MANASTTGPSRRQVALLVALHALAAVCVVAQPVPIRDVIDGLGRGEPVGYFVPDIVAIVVFGLAGAALLFAAQRAAAVAGYDTIRAAQNDLFGRLVRMPLLFFTTSRPGALVSRVTNDVMGMETVYSQVLPAVVSSVVVLAVSAGVLVTINPVLLLIFVIVPLCLVPIRYAERKINADIRDTFEITRDLSSATGAVLTLEGLTLTRQSGQTAAEEDRFQRLTDRLAATSVRTASWRASVGFVYGIVFTFVTSASIVLCAWLASRGAVTTGDLVLALVYSLQIREPITSLIGTRYPRIRARIARDRVNAVLDWREPVPPAASGVDTRGDPRLALELRDVRFRYPDPASYEIDGLSHVGDAVSIGWLPLALHERSQQDRADTERPVVLDGIDLSLRRGEMVAVVGSSGAGKSTLAAMAAGLMRPNAGAVLVDGRPIDSYTEDERSDRVAYIAQDTHVLHATVRENLSYAAPGAGEDALVRACEAAQFRGVVNALPDGFDTVVGEKGHRLSGGERQRLAIARALLRDPAVIVLDEPTAHLDAATEAALKEALVGALRPYAVLMIAHRLSTVVDADRIVVLHAGRVAEEGTHTELLARDGAYGRLFAAQQRGHELG